jgi:hypothetical protein
MRLALPSGREMFGGWLEQSMLFDQGVYDYGIYHLRNLIESIDKRR